MKQEPLISVITPAYNAAAYLPALIQSVQAQDYPHYEHIIIDDGSTDETVQVLARYAHLRWWSRPNKGQYATQNEALSQAEGEIIVIIAADDAFITPDAFSKVVAYWQQHPELCIVYGQVAHMAEDGSPLPPLEPSFPPWLWLLHHRNFIQHCSLFICRELCQQHRFDPHYRFAGDWDWILRLFTTTEARKIGHLPLPLSVRRVHQGQASRTHTRANVMAEARKVCQNYGGHYWLYRLLMRLFNWRAMALLGWHTLKNQGVGAFYHRVRGRFARG